MLRYIAIAAATLLLATPALAQDDPAYLDDGSTPELLVRSFYNAVSRYELGRAWTYLNPDVRRDYEMFRAEFEHVAHAEVIFGFPHGDGRPGTIYYDLPIIVQLISDSGEYSYQAGCIGVAWPLNDLQDSGPYLMPYVNYGGLQTVEGPAGSVKLPVCD